ncbi:hypothetical protein [Methylotenera versatilis]|uniref:hypothetical protein n=1 Tax=Methylotenera versatilis TaxID=1055487 RepID=UPI00064666EB|nr:hypothetical protein [Methylotenera versatilis]
MESEAQSITELENARNLALQKYGRNVYNFGLLESWLKVLVSRAEISGHVSELPEILNRQSEAIRNKTMGQVIKQFVEKIDPDYVPLNKEPLEVKDLYISHTFNLEIDNDEFQEKKLILEAISKDRNELIHHFHERFKFDSIQNCQKAIKFLDLQREECWPYFEEIRNLLRVYGEGMKEVAEMMNSEQFLNAIVDAN